MNWRPPKNCLLPLQVRQGCIPWILLERQGPCSCPLPQSPGPSPCPTNPATRTAGIAAVPAFAWIQSLCPRDNTAVKTTALDSPGSPCSFIFPHHHHHISLMESGTEQLKVAPEKLKKLLQRSSALVMGPFVWGTSRHRAARLLPAQGNSSPALQSGI